ncbi:MAG TPA: Calx-beta domain-containing protein, partial [Pseudoxanthomonas sp.]|nr:Calx-beta domain-containing protein [Pseudoxanthomonas sp.]
SGTFDVRWNNGTLNPAFATLRASDFEVIQLGWRPAATTAALSAVGASPNPVTGGQTATGTVTLTSAAPSGGAQVSLSSASSAFSVPANVSVAQGASSATFPIATVASDTTASGTLSATYAGVTRTSTVTVNAAPLSLSIGDASVTEGASGTAAMTFTVGLSRASIAAVSYNIATADGAATAGSDYAARSLTGETIAAGQTSRTFTVTVNGDQQREPNEAFIVNLSGATGATLADGQATGTIVSDDARVMSSPLPARPGTGSATQSSPPAPASPAQQTVPISTNACLLRGGALSCVRQMPLRWLQAWDRLLVLLTP